LNGDLSSASVPGFWLGVLNFCTDVILLALPHDVTPQMCQYYHCLILCSVLLNPTCPAEGSLADDQLQTSKPYLTTTEFHWSQWLLYMQLQSALSFHSGCSPASTSCSIFPMSLWVPHKGSTVPNICGGSSDDSHSQAACLSIDLLAVDAFLGTWPFRKCICVGALPPLKMFRCKVVHLEALNPAGYVLLDVHT
jgi:hypothetical protein